LAENGIQVEVLQTEAAVEHFNLLREKCLSAGYSFDLLTYRRVMKRCPLR
jgi:hypothetical protein